MLFVENNYDVQYNANRMNNMEHIRCHPSYSPLTVCGTIAKVKTVKKVANITTASAAAATITTQQQEKVQQYDFESLQVLEDHKDFLLNTKIVDVENITYPNNVRNDISTIISRKPQPKLFPRRSTLLKRVGRKQRLDPFNFNKERLNWHHILLAI